MRPGAPRRRRVRQRRESGGEASELLVVRNEGHQETRDGASTPIGATAAMEPERLAKGADRVVGAACAREHRTQHRPSLGVIFERDELAERDGGAPEIALVACAPRTTEKDVARVSADHRRFTPSLSSSRHRFFFVRKSCNAGAKLPSLETGKGIAHETASS